MDPAAAARVIVDGVARRRGRVLVGRSAKVLDVVARLLPSSYGPVLAGLTSAMARSRRSVTSVGCAVVRDALRESWPTVDRLRTRYRSR